MNQITPQAVGQTLGLTNPNAAQSKDLTNIAGDLNGTRNNLKGDIIQLEKDDPKLGVSSSGANQNGQTNGAPNGSSNNDAMIQMLIALLMQLLQSQGGNNNSNGQQQGQQQQQPSSV